MRARAPLRVRLYGFACGDLAPLHAACVPVARAVLQKKKEFVSPTETNLHRDGLCFMVKTRARHKTTETVLYNGWRLVAVGGWQLVAVGGGGSWRLVVPRSCR